MNYRARLTVAFLAIAALPLLVLGFGIRRELTTRLDAEAARRVTAAASAVDGRLTEIVAASRRRLEFLAAELADDNRFRIAIANATSGERRWLIDWAPAAMLPGGFAVLQVQDSTGRVLSSGQFRNDFDRVAPLVPSPTDGKQHGTIVDARTPAGSIRALVASHAFTVRGERFVVTGGPALDSADVAALSPGAVALMTTSGTPAPDGATAGVTVPWIDDAAGGTGTAIIHLVPDDAPVRAFGRDVTRWLLLTLGGTLLVALAVATLLGRVVSAPIAELAGRTARLDLDKLDQRFATGRDDELGALERTLDALTARLGTSVARLREAERAAATGDLARQVNHDVKNGLAPIRNVLRHLAQVAEREPATLASVFAERRGTLDASVEYLDQLARNYARLSPSSGNGRTDPRPVVLAVAQMVTAATVDVRLPDELPHVRGDAVVLHRILENIVSNAAEALEGKPGTITIGAEPVGNGAEQRVRFTVADTGRGMTKQELDRAFDDFHTTKPTGTGLGLSVVRRLLTDVGGSVRAETAPGEGSTFIIDIPVAVT